MEGGDLGGGKSARAACGDFICFEDKAGFTRRPVCCPALDHIPSPAARDVVMRGGPTGRHASVVHCGYHSPVTSGPAEASKEAKNQRWEARPRSH
ncbi:hypothetical protein GCM10010219_13980 [Streptomyces netropsis]|nr:hypothetical protein GCM10010219_13980 [Streptomyces netropsis]